MPNTRPSGRTISAPPGESERWLLEQARAGVPNALGVLYTRYAPGLYRLALRLSGSPADAEDALHDLFVGLPELLRRYDERGRLAAWLRAVMVRLVLAGARREQRRRRVVRAAEAAEAPERPAAAGDPWSALDLARALDALPDTLRTVFVLRQLEGHSHDEIAELLGITSGASRVRYLRALRRLRLLLEPES